MRILLDECVPRRLRRELPGHEVKTFPRQKFEVFLTVDQNLQYQQNYGPLVSPCLCWLRRAIDWPIWFH